MGEPGAGAGADPIGRRDREPARSGPRQGRLLVRLAAITVAIGLRRRPIAFFGLALLAAGAVIVAVASPLLLRAAQQSALAAATPPGTLAARITYNPSDPSTPIDPRLGQGVVVPESLWRTAVPATTSVDALPWQRVADDGAAIGGTTDGHLVGTALCAALHLVAGRCPQGTGQVAVPAASGVPIGALIRLTSTGQRPLSVVGRFAPGASGPSVDPLVGGALRSVDQDRGGDLVVDPNAIRLLAGEATLVVVGVGPEHAFRLEDLERVHRSLVAARRNLEQLAGGVIVTPIERVLAAQRVTAEAATLIALALAVQTLAVAWAAEALLVGSIARSRAGEWGVARLRGFRAGRRLITVFSEPVAAVLVGSVLGYLLATVLAGVVAAALTGAAIQPLRPAPLVFGGLAAIGSLVALVLASTRSATLPLARLLRERAEPRRIGRLALIAQSGAVLATALVVYSVLTGGTVTGPQLPLLAPALVAVTAGTIALRIAVPLLRRRLRPVPGSLTGLLVGRRLLRTPSLLATAVVLCAAVSLATAAAQTLQTSNRLQHLRAQAVVGAARVVDVQAAKGADLVGAVRRADPTGRLAMAAVDVGGAGPSRIVAVDTARLAAVSSWHPSWGRMSASRLHRLLDPAVGPSLDLTGRRLRVELADTAIIPDPSGVDAVSTADLRLTLTVQNSSGFHHLMLGRMDADRFTVPLPCSDGCRIVGFTVEDIGADASWAVNTVIASLATDTESAAQTAALLRPGLWRRQLDTTVSLDQPPTVRIGSGARGLALALSTVESRAVVGVVPRDTPQPLPVLAGPQLSLRPVEGVPGSFLGSGSASESILIRPIGRAEILPRALGDGVLVDLGVLQKVSDPAASYGREQVWLAGNAGPSVVAALQRQGLHVTGEQRTARVESGFLDGVVPRVAQQGAAIGAAGLALALLALLVARLLRRPSMRATARLLHAAGARQRDVRRIAFVEGAVPATAGALLGAAAGIAGSLLLLPALPLGAGAGLLPPLDVHVFAAAAVLPAAAAIALALAIAAATAAGGRR